MKKIYNKFMTTNIIKLYVIMLVIHFIWIVTVGGIFLLCGLEFSQHVADTSKFTNSLFLVPISALFEEILFRWIPMIITVSIVNKIVQSKGTEQQEHTKKIWMMIILVITAVVFGYLHGNILNIFLHGVSGLVFSAFYVRAYLRSDPSKWITRKQIIPLVSATLFHTLSNFIMIF